MKGCFQSKARVASLNLDTKEGERKLTTMKSGVELATVDIDSYVGIR